MEQLTKKQFIALEMLKGKPDLIVINMNQQKEIIQNALDFADYFLDLSEEA